MKGANEVGLKSQEGLGWIVAEQDARECGEAVALGGEDTVV